ncbi:hypothetical protein ABUL39_03760 [Rhodothermus marinus]|uniref:hypothetical protein n=1 Tax=Rhodothermus marinus TaxID=29549 RepID=UPI0037C5C825
MNWQLFFPPGAPIMALPSWQRPRLLLRADGAGLRWLASALYPAYRWSAHLRRWFYRARALLGAGSVRIRPTTAWDVPYLEEAGLMQAQPMALLVGTPGPAQKMVLALGDHDGRPVAYLKYAERPVGIRRLQREAAVLQTLPRQLGPRLLWQGDLYRGHAVLLSPLEGRPFRLSRKDLLRTARLLETLPPSACCPVDEHPALQELPDPTEAPVTYWLEVLCRRRWPVVPMHGDCAPWNLLQAPDGQVRMLDWEYGHPEGFPGVDLAYYLLQIAMLIRKMPPARALEWAVRQVLHTGFMHLKPREAEVLVRLAAWHAYREERRDGRPDEHPHQQWRCALWRHRV